MEELNYLRNGIKKLVDKCEDIDLLYLIRSFFTF